MDFIARKENVCALRVEKDSVGLKICSSQVVDKISNFGSVENVDTRPLFPLSRSGFEGQTYGWSDERNNYERSWIL